MDFMKPETVLDLNNIRNALVRMEESIVFALIERSQFYSSPSVYEPKKYIPNFDGSMLDWFLLQVERTHSQVRRYEAPDESPFFPDDLLPVILPSIEYPKILAKYSDEINVNDEIKQFYINDIVPRVSCKDGEQLENLGSVSCADIDCLQVISRRIHFGKFVAESKFQNDKETYTQLIKNKDVEGIDASITNKAVEDKILERLIVKAEGYGTDPSLRYSQNKQSKVDPKVIAQLYKDYIIPLTKKVEVEYLMRRLEDDL
ncbi:chorismate mutase aro7 [Yamadazyma tenuis]|uniref:Chorismate mutase n=1 Tax=Candida tenuis (strain ATCC 10573 / BCRC 21748 / CBS 615 / JCM 9827 / NBRC 10315 / NRRL Y-1498 / VKM Y-70) TaxID=590646 RepID=G3B215_CANTC|nr:chorismate mutase [Yamadazyma tenuis ATCC 10573]EGV64584.1 chorismate mutase [Yamadazyma tenuis ATCC 10573]WEJ97349.1 chorismate mutase aro7 [Yamadazyma tenuis]